MPLWWHPYDFLRYLILVPRAVPNVHQQMCTTGRPFQRLEGLLSNHSPPPPQKKKNKKQLYIYNEKVHCRNVSATFSRSIFPAWNFQAILANEKTHLGPTLNTCKVGSWRAALKEPSFLAILCSSACDRLMVHGAMRPEMITQIIQKQFFCVTDVCAIGKVIPRQLMCVVGTCTESTLWRRPNYTK